MKKILAILLTFSMLITAMAAFAEDTDSTQVQTPGMNEPGQFPGGERPDDMPEPPDGEKPDDAPELPSGEKPDEAPEKPDGKKPNNGKKPDGGKPSAQKPGDQVPEMLDWDKLVAEGVISEETAAKVRAYMEENKPGDMAEKPNGEKPADPPEKPDGEDPVNPNLEIVNQLLEAGVLTQEEADAVSVWITENMPMDSPANAK